LKQRFRSEFTTLDSSSMDLIDRCRRVELILSDVDGVLTDGGIWYDNQGLELKGFHIRDGLGIKLWQRAGFKFGVLTARSSHIVKVRTGELGIDLVRQGFEDKLPIAVELLREERLSLEQACYIGDDLTDLPLVRNMGLGVAVADASEEVRAAAHHVTSAAGGRGAVRELIETILKANGRWEEVIHRYSA
jgi:3-deoxy-D-manno-octulosonate 8-phosphate phosphatase (KDO 8-P phosphatase)